MIEKKPDLGGYYIFGSYRLDAQARSLTHKGEAVAITPKVFDILYLLVRNAGEVVDKEQFFREIWPGTVVEESNLSQNIFVLRRLLKEEGNNHRFIVTVPGRGYRFISTVRIESRARSNAVVVQPDVGEAQPGGARGEEQVGQTALVQRFPAAAYPEWLRIPFLSSKQVVTGTVLGLVCVGVAVALSGIWWRVEPVPLQWRAITALSGRESAPALSPDGSMVAFIWNLGHHRGTDLFLQIEGTSEPTRLTNTADAELSPTWSPDGRRLAFVRLSANALSVHAIDLATRDEQRVRDLFPHRTTYIGRYLAWSPDGRSLAIVLKRSVDDAAKLVLHSLDGGMERVLTQPASVDQGDSNPAYSYDGRHLAFVRTAAFNSGAMCGLSALGLTETLSADLGG
jgi:DNA-binding winged helix-turn-helix (wHTH) protein